MEINYTQEIDLGLAKILTLSNIINRKTDMCCFTNDVAHCSFIEIKLYKTKKEYNKIPAIFKINYDEGEYDKDSKGRLDEINRCVDFLEQTLKEKTVPYSLCEPIKEYVIKSYEI
jgi:hypothetical protein